MNSRLNRYLFFHFSTTFFPLFGALFLIASVVSFVQLSAMTSVIKIDFVEMFLLYLAQTPSILLYTLPITFFAGLTMTLAKLSSDLELIVLFSLKTSIRQILKPFFFLALLFSAGLLVIGLIVQPKAQFLQRALVYSKQDDAQINIRPSEFGQRFGNWLLFVGTQINQTHYRDVVLFSRAHNEESGYFVVANSAEVENDSGLLSLILREGRTYQTGDDVITQVDFEMMRVNEPGKLRALEYRGVVAHWMGADKSRAVAREFVWAIFAGLFVLLCLPATTLGIYNPRFGKNRAGVISLVLTVLFYVPAMTLGDKAILFSFLIPPLWFAFIYWLYRRHVAKTF